MTTQNTAENLRLALRTAGGITACVLATLLQGCASAGPRPNATLETTSQPPASDAPAGAAAELVFSGVQVQNSAEYVPAEWTQLAMRSDQRLGALEPIGGPSRVAYPEPEAPDLGRLRFIHLQPMPDRSPYFRRESRRHY
jgi:hypothetical protein